MGGGKDSWISPPSFPASKEETWCFIDMVQYYYMPSYVRSGQVRHPMQKNLCLSNTESSPQSSPLDARGTGSRKRRGGVKINPGPISQGFFPASPSPLFLASPSSCCFFLSPPPDGHASEMCSMIRSQ